MLGTSTFVSTWSAEETRELGRRLGRLLQPGDLVALEGELGSGKTVLVQGLAEGLGVTAPVHSPTFVLHLRYPGPVPLDHYDLYRMEKMSWIDAGLDEPALESVTVVEWPERAAPLDDWSTVYIRLDVIGETERRLFCLKGPDRIRPVFNDPSPRA